MLPKLLIIEDSKETAKILNKLFQHEYESHFAITAEDGLVLLESERPSVVIVDYNLPGMNGLEFITLATEKYPNTPIIMLTAFGSIEMAVEAMKLGAFNYLTKPIRMEELKAVVATAARSSSLNEENIKLREQLEIRYHFDNIIGKSEAVRNVYNWIRKLRNTQASVLLIGESGTGKQLIARTIHFNSSRKNHPFEMVDASTLAGSMLESELFGHEPGAFPGAVHTQIGRLERARGGTFYLANFDFLDAHLQARLLSALQNYTIQRMGGEQRIPVNVRFITSTQQPIQELLDSGRLRKDLYYLASVVEIPVPPLVDRPQDIPLLAEFFCKRACEKNGKKIDTFSPEAMKKMIHHDWLDNVRELENAVEYAVVVCGKPTIQSKHLPIRQKKIVVIRKPHQSLSDALKEPEKHIIFTTLKECGWNRKEAADLLKITRATLYNKMKKFKIESP